jgi:dephospho-CoA kinase
MTLVIGLAGRIGSGKGTVAAYLKERYKAKKFVYSDILGDMLDRLHLPRTRDNLQKLGKGIREQLGDDVLVNAMLEDVKGSTARILIIDGVRYVNEVDMVRGFDESLLIFTDAPVLTRYERCVARAQKGEGKEGFSDFELRDNAPTELELDQVKEMADHVIDNSGSVADLFEKVDEIMAGRR